MPNLVVVKVGSGGRVSIANAAGCAHVIVDIMGWHAPSGAAPAPGGLTGITPARLLDTRLSGQGPCVSSTPRALTVAGVGGVPANSGAVALNVTVTEPSANSWLTLFPTGTTQPFISNLNFLAGQTVPNFVAIKVGTGGQVSISNAAGCAHVIVDVMGWYASSGSAPGAGGFTGITPTRILDTRQPGQGPCVSGIARILSARDARRPRERGRCRRERHRHGTHRRRLSYRVPLHL